jgi:hypothetical protein
MSDFTLPKFKDYVKRNIVSFLESSDSYVQLKFVPAEMKLPKAMTPVTEEYTQQRVTAVYKELRNCQHFK